VGRELAQLPVGNGRTVDDAVADAWSSLLFSGTIDVSGRPPFTGQPNTTVRGDRQTRRYGPDGYPETDVDTGHDHNNSGDPHSHDWSRPTDGTPPTAGNRSVARPWRPSDPPPPRQCPVKK